MDNPKYVISVTGDPWDDHAVTQAFLLVDECDVKTIVELLYPILMKDGYWSCRVDQGQFIIDIRFETESGVLEEWDPDNREEADAIRSVILHKVGVY